MGRKMQAAVVVQCGKPVVMQERDIPEPGPGQILVKTEACGVHGTDVHAANGDWPIKPQLPLIPGHEAIGLIAAVGSGVTLMKEGDRVAVPWLFTTYKGLKQTDAKPGEWIAVSGAGALGHLAIQYAKVMGFHDCAIDIDEDKLAHAKCLGADLVVNARASDAVTVMKKETGGGTHGVFITAPSLNAFEQGVSMTRKRGTCVLIGLSPDEFPVSIFDVVANCITIRGSFVGSREDMSEALAFAAEGKVRADIDLQPLASINAVLGRLEHSAVAARVVLESAN